MYFISKAFFKKKCGDNIYDIKNLLHGNLKYVLRCAVRDFSLGAIDFEQSINWACRIRSGCFLSAMNKL